MSTRTTLELELSGQRLHLEVQRVSEVASLHTGQPLTQVHGTAATDDEAAHRELCRVLEAHAGRRVRSVEPFDERIRSWRLSWNSYFEADGQHRYALILQEEEDLLLQELVIGDVRLHPYEYREVVTDGELTISAKLVGSKSELLRLRALLRHHDSFPVVRRGISEVPREMRFGVAEWSRHEAQIRTRVVLVDAQTEPTRHPELLRIEQENTRAAVAFYMNFVEELALLLEAKGVVSARELETARSAARDAPWRTRQEFWQVPDVDLL